MPWSLLLFASISPFAGPAQHEGGADPVSAVASDSWSGHRAAGGTAPIFIEGLDGSGDAVRFFGRAGGVVAMVEPTGFSLRREAHEPGAGDDLLRFTFENARQDALLSGELPSEARFSAFLGNDPTRWVRGARSFDAVRSAGLYEGIDLLFRGDGGVLEYDLILAPGADLDRVRVAVHGASGIEIAEDGSLVVRTAGQPLVKPKPRTFQPMADGTTREVQCSYVLYGERHFGFSAPAADRALSLVVDPELHWSTYIGSGWGLGVGDVAYAVATGEDGDVFVAGEVEGPLFPVTAGAFDQGHPEGGDVFVARFRAEDGALLYACVLGGTEGGAHWQERPLAIAVDGLGRATVGGRTDASNFPTTPGAFQVTGRGVTEAFVFRVSPTGDLVWSTLLGGSWVDEVETLALSTSGAVVVGGLTGSADFPTTPGAWVTTFPSPGGVAGFLTRIDPTGSSLEWSTLVSMAVGGHGNVKGVALDAQEHVVVATQSGHAESTPGAWAPGGVGVGVLKLDPSGSELLWYSKFGRRIGAGTLIVEDLAIDSFGNPIVLGWTDSNVFPTTPGAFQPTAGPGDHGFVVRLHASGSHAIYSTYLGPSRVWALAADGSGMVTVTGGGPLFPTTPGAYQTTPFPVDLVVCRLSPAGDKLVYSTYIGGPGTDMSRAVAIDATRRVAVAGFSNGGYPTTPGSAFPTYIGGQTDAVVTTLDMLLEGLIAFSESVPACLGPLHASATEMPRADAGDFAFFCSGAPPSSTGALILGQPAPAPFGQSFLSVVPTLARIPVQSDFHGWVETPYLLDALGAGATFAAQYVFRTPHHCPGPRPWSTSNGLLVTVQP